MLDPLKRRLIDPDGTVVPISSAEFRLLTAFQLTFVYRFKSVGRNIRLDRGLFILPGRVSLGDNVFIGRYSFLDGEIEITRLSPMNPTNKWPMGVMMMQITSVTQKL